MISADRAKTDETHNRTIPVIDSSRVNVIDLSTLSSKLFSATITRCMCMMANATTREPIVVNRIDVTLKIEPVSEMVVLMTGNAMNMFCIFFFVKFFLKFVFTMSRVVFYCLHDWHAGAPRARAAVLPLALAKYWLAAPAGELDFAWLERNSDEALEAGAFAALSLK